MAEKGSEAFRMSDIVERTGVPFGSLYQYFPDKTAIIGTLAERYNAIGRDCVRRDLSAVKSPRDLHPALCRIVDSYYRMFIDEPVMRDIWQATRPTGRCSNSTRRTAPIWQACFAMPCDASRLTCRNRRCQPFRS
jgi:AcrR family transcriptional regulator